MSLNGLDDPAVRQALTSAVAEAAGWLFLNYSSRDTVSLLGHGSAGVLEARACMTAYPENSPLYGLIMFRRKRILIKYIPDGTSRLLVVRTRVHFTDILDSFGPQDALLEITTVDGLSDTALAAMFPSHTGSASANNLDEIAEDGEEPGSPTRKVVEQPVLAPAERKRDRKAALDRMAAYQRAIVPSPTVDSAKGSLEDARAQEKNINGVNEESARDEMRRTPDERRPEPHTDMSVTYRRTSDSRQEHVPYASSSLPSGSLPTSRTESSFDDYAFYDYKPKIKLAPRPVQVTERKRASQMPASVRRTTNHTTEPLAAAPPAHPVEQTTIDAEKILIPTDSPMLSDDTPPAAKAQAYAERSPKPQMPGRMSSAASLKSARSTTRSVMTPEKQRLIKAMEMRKRNAKRTKKDDARNDPVNQAALNGTNGAIAEDQQKGPDPSADSVGSQTPRGGRTRQNSEIHKQHSPEPAGLGFSMVGSSDPSLVSMSPERGALANPEYAHRRTSDASNPSIALSRPQSDRKRSNDIGIGSSPSEPSSQHHESLHKGQLRSVTKDEPTETIPRTSMNTKAGETQAGAIANGHDSAGVTASPQNKPAQLAIITSENDRGTLVPRDSVRSETSIITQDEDDDDLEYFDTDEAATLHEATSVSVMRSPATPVFGRSTPSFRSHTTPPQYPSPPGSRSGRARPISARSTTAVVDDDASSARPHVEVVNKAPSSKSSSPAKTPESMVHVARQGQLGSGISERIAKLAESRDTSPTASRKDYPVARDGLNNRLARKTKALYAFLPPTEDGPLEPVLDTKTSTDQPFKSRSTQPTHPPPRFDGKTFYTIHKDSSSPQDSISVTARIVRSSHGSTRHSSQDLQEPHVVHTTKSATPVGFSAENPALPQIERRPSIDHSVASTTESGRFKRLSWSFNRSHTASIDSTNDSTFNPPRHPSPINESQPDHPEPPTSPSKRDTRASRFLKRMSTLSAASRNSHKARTSSYQAQIQPTYIEKGPLPEPPLPHLPAAIEPTLANDHAHAHHSATESESPLPPLRIGDVNVQFPYSNLWKRRYVEIDTQGNLVFFPNEQSSLSSRTHSHPTSPEPRASLYKTAGAPGGGPAAYTNGVRAFDLRAVRKIYVPAVDDVGVAYAVVLELRSGDGDVVVGCEDGVGQRELLNVLVRYHQSRGLLSN